MAMPGLGPVEDSGRQVGGGGKGFLTSPQGQVRPNRRGVNFGGSSWAQQPRVNTQGVGLGEGLGAGGGRGAAFGAKIIRLCTKNGGTPPLRVSTRPDPPWSPNSINIRWGLCELWDILKQPINFDTAEGYYDPHSECFNRVGA